MPAQTKLILASGSPRRRQLLDEAGLTFELAESGVEERRDSREHAREYAVRMARAKAFAVSTRVSSAIVLAADTVVECAGEILEKPVDAADVRRMLRILSGRAHTVVTAFALAWDGWVVEADAVESKVFFRFVDDAEIDQYIATGEPFDKAGAYGVQGSGGRFIEKVEGPRDNVMGLPMREVLAALSRHGIVKRG
jgi:septum formation protein